MKSFKDLTLEELWEEVAKIEDDERREAAYELLSQIEKLEQDVANRVIKTVDFEDDQP